MRSRFLILILVQFILVASASAVKLSDYNPYDYEVRFTNPKCKAYPYSPPTPSLSGEILYKKPANVFCTSSDKAVTSRLERTPQAKLIDWIEDHQTEEIFMTYLSFSDSKVQRALCQAVEERGLKLTFILDNPLPRTASTTASIQYPWRSEFNSLLAHKDLKLAKKLLQCRRGSIKPTLYLRGNQNGLGYAHNKIFMVNPNSRTNTKVAFSSANLSSGTVLHHENWHFVATSPHSYFAQIHQCIREGMIKEGMSKRSYSRFVNSCRRGISTEQEEDIQVFIAPVDAKTKGMDSIAIALAKADAVDIAAHRFSNNKIVELLGGKLENSEVEMRLVVDDDMYWIANRSWDRLGSNSGLEYRKVQGLKSKGLKVKYMQTNQWYFAQRDEEGRIVKWAPTIHHNKYLIFYKGSEEGEKKPFALFTGAGNLTGTAFSKNFENFYMISIPEVLEVFASQYRYKWNELASSEGELPRDNRKPDIL